MAFQIQYKGSFGGSSSGGRWFPAVTGTLNQTNESDAVASTFDDRATAQEFLDEHLLPEAEGVAVEFRIEEVDPAEVE